jgi:hypothetical protein
VSLQDSSGVPNLCRNRQGHDFSHENSGAAGISAVPAMPCLLIMPKKPAKMPDVMPI